MRIDDVAVSIRALLEARKDIRGLTITAKGGLFDAYYEGGPSTLEDGCVFDECSKDAKLEFLRFYFSQAYCDACFSWNINVELAKLAAKSGRLVRDEAERCLYEGFEREHWTNNVLRVAYFGSDICYENRLVDLIEKRAGDCGDGYDGLFIACWFANSRKVDVALAGRIVDWLKNDTLDRGECSLADIFRLIEKWEQKGRCAVCMGLRGVYRDYIRRHGDVDYFKNLGLW